jgi:hypothetical protein
MAGSWKIFKFQAYVIDIKVWMNDLLQKLNDVFVNRVWFVGLQGSYGRGEATTHKGLSQNRNPQHLATKGVLRMVCIR